MNGKNRGAQPEERVPGSRRYKDGGPLEEYRRFYEQEDAKVDDQALEEYLQGLSVVCD